MTDVIFDDFYSYIVNALLGAKYEVKIAVAWINFQIYKGIFEKILSRNIKLEIIINDDIINAKNDFIINHLRTLGAIIIKIKMPTSKQYMHEKFCVIDSEKVLCGSYNWSKNANKNFENLIITGKKVVVEKFLYEFHTIRNLKMLYINNLQKTQIYNIMVLEQEDNDAVGIIYNVQDGELNEIDREYYQLSVLTNLEGIYDKYDYDIEQAYDVPEELEVINSRIEFEIQQYFSIIRNTKTSVPIHAIGRVARELYYPDEENVYIRIIWKERFCASYIEDRYYF